VAAARFFERLVDRLAGGMILAFALNRAVPACFAGARFGVTRFAAAPFRVLRFGFVCFTRRLLMIHLP